MGKFVAALIILVLFNEYDFYQVSFGYFKWRIMKII